MAKVIPIDLKTAKQKMRGQVDFRETTKCGVIAAKVKWPKKRKTKK